MIIGLSMHFIFRHEERSKAAQAQDAFLEEDETSRPLWQTGLYFLSMVGVLVFVNWARPEETTGIWHAMFRFKWILALAFGVMSTPALAVDGQVKSAGKVLGAEEIGKLMKT